MKRIPVGDTFTVGKLKWKIIAASISGQTNVMIWFVLWLGGLSCVCK